MKRLHFLAWFLVLALAQLACGGTSTPPTATPMEVFSANTAAPAATATAPQIEPSDTPTPLPKPTKTLRASPTPTRTLPPPTNIKAAPTTKPAPTVQRTLRLQTPPLTGDDVLELQTRLLELGYFLNCRGEPDPAAMDGEFGSMTDRAVRYFQALNGLTVDGVVGPKTWAALFNPNAAAAERQKQQAPLPTPLPAPPPSRRGLIAFASTRAGEGGNDIYVMQTDGAGVTRLTTSPANETSPAWSPDGSRIAFVSDRTGTLEIWVMHADGSAQTQLTCGGYIDPAWSPDGSRLAFVTPGDLCMVQADGSGFNCLPPANPDMDLHPEDPAWRPDGAALALSMLSTMNGNEILLFTLADRSVKLLTVGNVFDPDWSPDGGRLAASDGTDIYVMQADGSGLARLTNTNAQAEHPAWSPDGTRLAFDSNRNGKNEIWIMNADGSGQFRFINNQGGSDQEPDWQPQ